MRRILSFVAITCCLLGTNVAAQDNMELPAVNIDSCLCNFFDNYRRDFRTNLPVTFDRYIIDDEQRILDV